MFLGCFLIGLNALPAWADLCNPDDAADPSTFAGQFAQGADCGHEALACRWTFDLGAPASRALFEDMRARIGACSKLDRAERDQGVNHPDFYDAWVFPLAATKVMVSIKDKSALEKTYVVLRLLPFH